MAEQLRVMISSTARELLEDVREAAERGPYPLFQADAYNILAPIERDEGDAEAAIEAATKAYRLAWCDGPPFDESKFEPMPEVEINPRDEFYVDEGSIDSN